MTTGRRSFFLYFFSFCRVAVVVVTPIIVVDDRIEGPFLIFSFLADLLLVVTPSSSDCCCCGGASYYYY